MKTTKYDRKGPIEYGYQELSTFKTYYVMQMKSNTNISLSSL